MQNEVRDTLKSISIYNLIILVVILSSGAIFGSKYIVIIVFGLLIGILNIYFRALMLSYIAQDNSKIKSSMYLLGYFVRVGFTAVIGALLFSLDKYYVVSYIFGYILHFSGVMLHGFKLKVSEGK